MAKELPKNWVETNVKTLSILLRGVSYKKKDAKEVKETGDFLILRGGNIQDGKIEITSKEVYVDSSFVKSEQGIIEGDVIIVGSTGSKKLIGKAAIASKNMKEVTFGAFLMLIRPKKNINHKYFDYYFISEDYRTKIRELAGGININNIRRNYIEDLKFNLPPLAEQERIVKNLDDLFERLDKIKTSLAKIPVLLRNFRQQVLNQAVTGKLTEDWRENNVIDEGKELSLKELGDWKGGGTPSKAKKEFWTGGNVLWITPKDMKSTYIDTSINKITRDAVENSSANLLPANCILFVTRSGILRRVFPISSNTKETTVNQDIKALILKPEFDYHFVLYALRGLELELRQKCMKSGTTVESIDFKKLKNYKLRVPEIEEQKEIVNLIENLFTKADKIQTKYKLLKTKLDQLPQAILHKAFKGELVPQLESDGEARHLLSEIEDLKKSAGSKPKKGKTKKYKTNEEELLEAAEEKTKYKTSHK